MTFAGLMGAIGLAIGIGLQNVPEGGSPSQFLPEQMENLVSRPLLGDLRQPSVSRLGCSCPCQR